MIYLILIQLINIFFQWRYVKFQLRLPRLFTWFSSNEEGEMRDAMSKTVPPKNSGYGPVCGKNVVKMGVQTMFAADLVFILTLWTFIFSPLSATLTK